MDDQQPIIYKQDDQRLKQSEVTRGVIKTHHLGTFIDSGVQTSSTTFSLDSIHFTDLNSTTTANPNWADIPGLTKTYTVPPGRTRTILILLSGHIKNTANYVQIGIFVGGLLKVYGGHNAEADFATTTIQFAATLNSGTTIVKGVWQVGSATADIDERTLTIITFSV